MGEKINEDFTACYHRLGLQRPASWGEIRLAYRRAMRRWHPDRHMHASHRHRQAEQETKEVASAYRRLAQYYRQHGHPPPYGGVAPHAEVAFEPVPRTERSQANTAAPLREGSPSPDPPPAATPRAGQFWFSLGLVAVLGYFIFGQVSRDPPSVTEEIAPFGQVPATPERQRLFSIGSSPQEVYAAQGVPDRMEKDVWYYGQARVYFVDGKVDRWETTPDTPLRATLSPTADPSEGVFFTLGSTQDYVRAVQGTPTREGKTVWEYGTSKVYFDENGQVTGWEESPFFALRVRRESTRR